ncbi:MAG: hypothetical protein J6N56_02285, partial [Bacteroidales bacterium]|nr:hypothetical protein [Bacteroidales bacterium]
EEYGYQFKGQKLQNSRYLDNEERQKRYRRYLDSGEGKRIGRRIAEGYTGDTSERFRYLACQKALSICEAAAKYPDNPKQSDKWRTEQDRKRIAAANKAAIKWDKENTTIDFATKEATPAFSFERLLSPAERARQIKDSLGEDYSETEIMDLLQLKQEMEKDLRMSKLSAEKIAAVLRSFRDPRRFEFLGDFIAKYISSQITLIQTDPEIREALGIAQMGNRKDYFLNPSAANAIQDSIKDLLLEKAEACPDPNLAQELRSAADQLPTLMYMFGGRIFRNEGVSVDENGIFTVPTSSNSSVEQNDNNEDNDDDNPDDSEKPVDAFSASDQNKSVSSKIVPNIKLLLSSITEVDSEGNEIQDKYGYGLPIYISAPSAVNKILHTCMGCQSFCCLSFVKDKNSKAIHNQILLKFA